MMAKAIFVILDLILVLDACIGIFSGSGMVFDYLVLIVTLFVLLLSAVYYWARRKCKSRTDL